MDRVAQAAGVASALVFGASAAAQGPSQCTRTLPDGRVLTSSFGTARFVGDGTVVRIPIKNCNESNQCATFVGCFNLRGGGSPACVNDQLCWQSTWTLCQPAVQQIATCSGDSSQAIFRLIGPAPGGVDACRAERVERLRRRIRQTSAANGVFAATDGHEIILQ